MRRPVTAAVRRFFAEIDQQKTPGCRRGLIAFGRRRRTGLCSRLAWASSEETAARVLQLRRPAAGAANIGAAVPPDTLESEGLTMNLESSNGAATVLVVEDEPLILDMISGELTEQGFAVLEAETGEAALSIIESGQRVDVLFTDIRLPGELDGWRLAATAREAKPELPVIYATGYTVDQGAAVPSSVFLKKPYRPSAITQIIRTLIAPTHWLAGAPFGPAQGERAWRYL